MISVVSRRCVPAMLSALALIAVLAGCGSSGGSHTVPSLGGHSSSTAATGRAATLDAMAQCIRAHGVPSFADPVLTAGGQVYYDLRSVENASRAAQNEARQACGALAARAGFSPTSEPPAPPALVAAGVRAAQCLRANGMTTYRDPTSSSPYVPGHGFSLSSSDVPAGGKSDPTVQRAFQACARQLRDEIQASTLSSLGHD